MFKFKGKGTTAMKLKDLRKQKGFTIIEVLIVLTIAGAILLVVFLAVPALQRNSRNTQRKQDVAAMLAGLTEYVNNNAGQLPADQTTFDTNITNPTSGNAKIAFFQGSDVTYSKVGTTRGTAPAPSVDAGKVYVYNYVKCNGTAPTITGASARSIAAIFWTETANNTSPQCQES